jgi:hypothetical protein
VPTFLLEHRHDAADCAAVFASWHGFTSPLREHSVTSTCLAGGHRLWWRVEADSEAAALALLPSYVAARTDPIRIREIEVP